MIAAKLISADVHQKMDDKQNDKLQLHEFKMMDLKLPVQSPSDNADVTSFSKHISTEDTEISSPDISTNVNQTAEFPVESNPKCGVTRKVSIGRPSPVETDQPKPLCALLPSTDTLTVYEVSQSFTSISKSQGSLKTMTAHTEPDGEDLCAAILLACLFCQPLDCLMATVRGCNKCVWSLCSSLCGCETTTLQPLMDITHHCDLCSCLGAHCFMCDCPFCDICLQATECLDLAMEISQMLYH